MKPTVPVPHAHTPAWMHMSPMAVGKISRKDVLVGHLPLGLDIFGGIKLGPTCFGF